jgi:glycosyltransferase involved in cell wall biosynthesis
LLAIRHAIFHNTDFARGVVVPNGGRLTTNAHEEAVYASTILYTSLERDSVDAELVAIFRKCAEMWVPCRHNREALIDSGMPAEQVQVIPYPYDPASPVCRIPAPRGTERVPEGKRFYCIGKWEPRKNHAVLLRAFLCAYGPRDKASLTLKVHGWGDWEGYPRIEEAVADALREERARKQGWNAENIHKRVRIVPDKISDEAIVELHRQNNIYVSASHGEAWDIPAFEAKCAGNRLVHVGYGGSAEYASDTDDIWVPYTMGSAHPAYGWGEARWAEYKFDDLVCALQRAEPPARRVHPPEFNGRFSVHAVGELMKQRVLDLASRRHISKLLMTAGSYA